MHNSSTISTHHLHTIWLIIHLQYNSSYNNSSTQIHLHTIYTTPSYNNIYTPSGYTITIQLLPSHHLHNYLHKIFILHTIYTPSTHHHTPAIYTITPQRHLHNSSTHHLQYHLHTIPHHLHNYLHTI
jgi:hypothetical protein